MMSRVFVVSVVALLGLGACEKKEAPVQPAEETKVAAPQTPAAPPPAPVAEPTIDASTLPVEEQYEADAEQEITVDNVAAKVAELEKEIDTP